MHLKDNRKYRFWSGTRMFFGMIMLVVMASIVSACGTEQHATTPEETATPFITATVTTPEIPSPGDPDAEPDIVSTPTVVTPVSEIPDQSKAEPAESAGMVEEAMTATAIPVQEQSSPTPATLTPSPTSTVTPEIRTTPDTLDLPDEADVPEEASPETLVIPSED